MGLAIVLLMLVFRSVLVPVKATLGFLLTIAATFGAVVAVFQWGWLAGLFGVAATGPIMSLLPIFMVGILFGLAMDYQVFLVTRMREDFVHGATPTESVVGRLRAQRPGRHRRRDHHGQPSSPASCSPRTRSSSPSGSRWPSASSSTPSSSG